MTKITLDIETIPSQLPWVKEYIAATVKPPGTMKKQETIDKWIAEEKENAISESMDKCSFDGAMNHIICIGVAIDDAPAVAVYAKTIDDEKIILNEFYDLIRPYEFGTVFIGHNISGFDLKVIRQRSMVLGIKPLDFIPFNSKPWELNPYDTMAQWDQKNSVKLDKIARAFGIEGKGDVDGSMVYQMWKDGKFDEIAQYCKDDVELTRRVYKKMTFQE